MNGDRPGKSSKPLLKVLKGDKQIGRLVLSWGGRKPRGRTPSIPHMRTHAHVRARKHTYPNAHTRTCMHKRSHTHVCAHTYVHNRIHTHTHTRISTHIHARTRTHIRMYTAVYTRTHVHNARKHICARKHTRTPTHTHARTRKHAHTCMHVHICAAQTAQGPCIGYIGVNISIMCLSHSSHWGFIISQESHWSLVSTVHTNLVSTYCSFSLGSHNYCKVPKSET